MYKTLDPTVSYLKSKLKSFYFIQVLLVYMLLNALNLHTAFFVLLDYTASLKKCLNMNADLETNAGGCVTNSVKVIFSHVVVIWFMDYGWRDD